MTKTPEEWLAYLTAKMDKERPRTDLLRSYTNGSSPLPEMGPNLAKAWLKFQRRARTNPGKLVVSALVDRLIPNGVTVGASEDSPAAQAAVRIWRDNRLKVVFSDAIWDAATSWSPRTKTAERVSPTSGPNTCTSNRTRSSPGARSRL